MNVKDIKPEDINKKLVDSSETPSTRTETKDETTVMIHTIHFNESLGKFFIGTEKRILVFDVKVIILIC